jgi:hypothetical protein
MDQAPRKTKAGEMQLDDWKKVTEEVRKTLKAKGFDDKKLDALQKEHEALEKRRRAEEAAKEKNVAPQRGGTGKSLGGQELKPGSNPAPPADLSNGGRPKPPPGYREAEEDFRRLLSKPDGPSKP